MVGGPFRARAWAGATGGAFDVTRGRRRAPLHLMDALVCGQGGNPLVQCEGWGVLISGVRRAPRTECTGYRMEEGVYLAAVSISFHSAGVSWRAAAAVFSSRCLTELV